MRRPAAFRRRVLLALGFGLAGAAALAGLGLWQMQRLAWKEGVIATLSERLAAAPVALPTRPDPDTFEFRRVRIVARFDGAPGAHGFADAPLITSLAPFGPGYRVIQPAQTADGRRVMVDRGYVPLAEKNRGGAAAIPTPATPGEIEITGALRWPGETADPPFGAGDNVWIARDLGAMAELFGAEPLLIVAETPTAEGPWPRPLPLGLDIPNNHLQYAITWFALAAVWIAMSLALARREARRPPD